MKQKLSLERYNHILWAGIGTAVVAVTVIAVLAAAAIALYVLLKSRPGVPVAVVDEDAGGTRGAAHYDFCHPVAVHRSPYQLIRVVTDRLVVRNKPVVSHKRVYGSYSSETWHGDSCGIYGTDRPAAVTNVLARHTGSGALRLLLKENAVVRTLEYPRPPVRTLDTEADQTFPPPGVLYWEIAFEDSNGDNVIDETDDAGAYFSDIDGRNFVRVTPAVSRVLEKTYDGRRKVLAVHIVRDVNGDRRLDDQDAPSLIEVGVPERKMLREVLDRQSLQQMVRTAERQRTSPGGNR